MEKLCKDIIFYLAAHLRGKDIISLSLINKKFYRVIMSNEFWLYKLNNDIPDWKEYRYLSGNYKEDYISMYEEIKVNKAVIETLHKTYYPRRNIFNHIKSLGFLCNRYKTVKGLSFRETVKLFPRPGVNIDVNEIRTLFKKQCTCSVEVKESDRLVHTLEQYVYMGLIDPHETFTSINIPLFLRKEKI